ncbi:unnamed protein product [Angiostrongylus costaricensis]|uniref:Kunitz/Bovine pancreatic trypsin inhibitor domain protein n=1 Tax=Angiostrongylus costaricensis TaxID=334426 RepID=A0A158PDQ6_ANGCS|nr:unnamed protein product [Angiostrongylus costaricensis]
MAQDHRWLAIRVQSTMNVCLARIVQWGDALVGLHTLPLKDSVGGVPIRSKVHSCKPVKVHEKSGRKNSVARMTPNAPLRGLKAHASSGRASARHLCKVRLLGTAPCAIVQVQTWRFIGCDDFPEVHDCIGGLCCPSRAMVCIQPLDTGDFAKLNSTTTRWHYDPISHSCWSFQFSGVGGNANNFLNEEHCKSYCVNTCPRGMPQTSGSSSMLFQRSDDNKCLPGAGNCDSERFQCIRVGVEYQCCPSRGIVCNQPQMKGVACLVSPVSRFWYNSTSSSCQLFLYSGCQGNLNNFPSLESCQQFCEGVEGKAVTNATMLLLVQFRMLEFFCSFSVIPQCPLGDALRLAGMPQKCSIDLLENECPRNYECHFDGRTYGCCPTLGTINLEELFYDHQMLSNTSVLLVMIKANHAIRSRLYDACSSSEYVLLSSLSGTPVECLTEPCPSGYSCLPDVWNRTRMCPAHPVCELSVCEQEILSDVSPIITVLMEPIAINRKLLNPGFVAESCNPIAREYFARQESGVLHITSAFGAKRMVTLIFAQMPLYA